MQHFHQTRLPRVTAWSLVALLLVGFLALAPVAAQAASPAAPAAAKGHGGHWGMDNPMLGGFWITGVIVTVDGENIAVRLPDHRDEKGFMRNITVEVTMAVDSNTLLLGGDLSAITAADLEEGDEVVIVPRLVWGNLTAKMIFAGAPEDLADHVFAGRLMSEVEDTLTLESRRDGEFQVSVDEDTIWYDGERVDRPAELPEDARLRVLGVEQEDGTIRAVLVASAARGF